MCCMSGSLLPSVSAFLSRMHLVQSLCQRTSLKEVPSLSMCNVQRRVCLYMPLPGVCPVVTVGPLQIPKAITESEVRDMFKVYGDIVQLNVRTGGGAMQTNAD